MKYNALLLQTFVSILIIWLSCGLYSPKAHAQGQSYNENTLYSFGTDGSSPAGNLINVNGIFYGTTEGDGSNNLGTVYSFNPTTHAEKVLYSFTGANGDGAAPEAGLTYDSASGKLYGTTGYGGQRDVNGNTHGTIFSINLNGTGYQTLYSFKGIISSDGDAPYASMIEVNGILYGTTPTGGTTTTSTGGYGTVFAFDPATHTEKVLHIFTGAGANGNGDGPIASLLNVGGILYGTTAYGGTHDNGTIFSINTDGSSFKLLYNFQGAFQGTTDGSGPESTLININGIFYGTTARGGSQTTGVGNSSANDGTIFSFNPSTLMEKTLYSFTGVVSTEFITGNNEAKNPIGDLVYDSATGKLFGNTSAGGNYNGSTDATGYGTAFSFDLQTSTEDTFYRFHAYTSDGFTPRSGLLDVNGTLYGTTYYGGTNGGGTIFSLTPVTLTPPVARSDSYAPKYATAYAVKAPGVLANDNAGGSNRPTAALVSSVTHGTLTFNTDGSFTYTPASGFVGTDTFTYQASNPLYQSNTATVSLVVQAVVPVAHNDTYAPIYSHAYKVNASGVLANDYAGDTGSLTAKLVSSVSHGTLTLNADGSFLYSPTFEYSGTDSFTYTATNAIGTSNTATVTFTITPVVPIAHNDTYAPKYATAYGVSAPGVLGNDDDGGTSPMTAALVTSPTHGALTFSSNGSFTYTPTAGFVGTDTFTYKDTTPTGTGNTATVTLNVTAALPVAHNDSYAVAHNKAYAVKAPGVLANDYTGDTGTLTAKLGTTTAHGILTFNADGSFNYTPATGYSGSDSFTYQAVNAIGKSNTATVTLTVQ